MHVITPSPEYLYVRQNFDLFISKFRVEPSVVSGETFNICRLSPSSLGQTTPTDSPSGGNSTTPNRRNNRPLSGVFSTPPADNYFTSHQPQSQQHEQLSPSFSTNRRRSANNNTVTEDYMTAKHLPLINALGVASSTSPAVAIAAAVTIP